MSFDLLSKIDNEKASTKIYGGFFLYSEKLANSNLGDQICGDGGSRTRVREPGFTDFYILSLLFM